MENQTVADELVEARRRIANLEAAQLELQQKLNFQQVLMDRIPNPLFYKDANGAYQFCNTAFAEKVLGLPKTRIVGSTVYDLPEAIPPHLADVYHDRDMELIRTPGVQVYEGQVKYKDDTLHDIIFNKATILDAEDKVRGMVGVMLDVSDLRQAEAELKALNQEMEKRAEERERLQQEVIEAQQRAIAELSTPIIPMMDQIIVMPLIGSIDSLRARDITRTLLAGITQHRAKVVILDVTGVGIMDTGIVNHLNKTIQAARLKGAQTIVTGMSDAVAEAIVDLGIDWSGIATLSNLQSGLMAALNSLGLKLSQ